jgi:hypothetical protein
MYPYYAKWIRSHRDLPLRLNQWNSVGTTFLLSPYPRNIININSAMGVQAPPTPPQVSRVPVARVCLYTHFLV